MTSSQSPDLKREEYGRQTNGAGQCADPQAGRAVSGWQPISSAPKEAKVLLYWPETVVGAHRQATLPEMVRVDYTGSTPNRLPTHWMPLPAPPSSAKPAERDSSRDDLETLRAQLALAVGVLRKLGALHTHFREATSGNQSDAYYTFVKGEDETWKALHQALAALSPQEELEEVSSAESVTPLAAQGGDTEAQSPAGSCVLGDACVCWSARECCDYWVWPAPDEPQPLSPQQEGEGE